MCTVLLTQGVFYGPLYVNKLLILMIIQVDIFIGNLPEDEGERADQISKWFSDHGVELSDVRSRQGKPFAHATLANAADKDKALGLSGEEMDGNPLRIDNAGRPNAAAAGGGRGGRGGGRGGFRKYYIYNNSPHTVLY